MLRSLKDKVGIRWNTLCFLYRNGVAKTARFVVVAKNQDSVVLLCDYIHVEVNNDVLIQFGVKPSDLNTGYRLEFRLDGSFTGRVDRTAPSFFQPTLTLE